jgi:hypothetical protein
MIFAVMIFAVLFAMPAQAAVYWSQKFARFSATAGETLATGDVVTIKDADGYAYLADANDAALRPAAGVVGKGGASGASVEIVVSGVLEGNTSLTESGPGYLSETAGDITQSAPAYSQQVGYAISSTAYLINCQNYFDSSSLTVLGTLTGASPFVLEGATADSYETTVAVTDPTADNTIYFPDTSGVTILSSAVPQAAYGIWGANNAFVFEGTTADGYETTVDVADPTADVTFRFPALAAATYGIMSSTLATNGPDIANSVSGGTNSLIFEGATADAYETILSPVDPTADRTVTIPNRTGQIQLASAASALTPGAGVTLTVGLSNVYTLTLTDNEDSTITFSGAGTAGDEITLIITTAGTADEVVTFHATLVSSVGTLTAGTDAGKYYVVKFISNGTHWFEVSRTAVQT